MKTLRVTFPNADGLELSGVLGLPSSSRPAAWALLAHCFTCGKDLTAARTLAEALADQGIATLRFDFTGLGRSEGDFADTTFSHDLADLVAAADWLQANHGAPQLLIGHSLGGAAVLFAAQRIPSARAVVTIGAPFHPEHVARLLGDAADVIDERGEATVQLAGRPFTVRKAFVDDVRARDPQAVLRTLRKALLVLHAPLDASVSIDNAAYIYQAARHPKSFISLDGADHLLSERDDARYAGRTIASWAERYLELAPPVPLDPGEHEVVTHTGAGSFHTEIVAGPHRFVADEPASVGGDDDGPDPYELLQASLGACTSMTLQMYARRKRWPLHGARVRLTHRKIHVEDCADCESEGGKIDEIVREIELQGPLDDSQRARLLEIADRCPVHRTLHGETKVRSHLRPA